MRKPVTAKPIDWWVWWPNNRNCGWYGSGQPQDGDGHAEEFGSPCRLQAVADGQLNNLVDGTHIECKDLDELLGAEAAIESAAERAKAYLDMAATFDGREVVLDVA